MKMFQMLCQVNIIKNSKKYIAGWTGVIPALTHNQDDEGLNPSPATIVSRQAI